MKVVASVYNLDTTRKWNREAKVDMAADSSTRVMTVPEIEGLSATWFVALRLEDPSDDLVSENFYWLSTAPETLEGEKSTYYHTPTKTFADYTALASLSPVQLKLNSSSKPGSTTVSVTNPSKALAFGLRLKVLRATDREEVLPVLWEDNYFALLPGETRQLTATYPAKVLGQATPVVEIKGWNVKP